MIYIKLKRERNRIDRRESKYFFNKLYDATYEKVLSYITAKCGKTADIEDIFMETYTEVVSIIRKRGTGYIKNSEAFVLKIAKRKIYRHYSLLQHIVEFRATYNYEEDSMESVDDEKISLEEGMMNSLTVDKAVAYLGEKDELTKKVFYLHYYMDKTIKEIAELLSIGESNVKNRLYRTLKELREHLIKEGMM